MNRTTLEAGSTAYGVSDESVTTTSPFSRCSASRRTASSASESIFTTGNFSSRSSARTPTQYVCWELSVVGIGVSDLSGFVRGGRALTQHEVAQPEITDGDDKRDSGHHRPSAGEVPKRHGTAGALRDSDNDDVGAGP